MAALEVITGGMYLPVMIPPIFLINYLKISFCSPENP